MQADLEHDLGWFLFRYYGWSFLPWWVVLCTLAIPLSRFMEVRSQRLDDTVTPTSRAERPRN